MSSDDGIYILKTLKGSGFEYRVAEMMAVENYSWDSTQHSHTNNPDVQIKNARNMWGRCEVHTDHDTALAVACDIEKRILEQGCPTEYGICSIFIPREF